MTEPVMFHEDSPAISPTAADVDERSFVSEAAVLSARVAFQRASLLMFDAIVLAIRAVTAGRHQVSDNLKTAQAPTREETLATQKRLGRLKEKGLL
jgi:hypothetical protein